MAFGWEYILAQSKTMAPIGKLRGAKSRTLAVDLNKSGSASAMVPMSVPKSKNIFPWSTCIIAQYTDENHDEFVFWSGPINSRSLDLAAGTVSFTCVGWFERLMHITLQQETMEFSEMDAGAIAGALLTYARGLDPNLPITIGTIESTQLRTITYTLDQNIGQAILDLSNLESGFDFFVDPITRQLNIYARLGSVLRDLKWTFISDGKSERSNLSNLAENVDGSTLVNLMYARSNTISSDPTPDFQSQDQYGLFMQTDSLSDVNGEDAKFILNAYTNAEIIYRSQPRVTYTLTPKPNTHARVPKLFRDFDIGDTGFLTARRDWYDITDQAVRAFGVSLNISDVGTETISNLQVIEN